MSCCNFVSVRLPCRSGCWSTTILLIGLLPCLFVQAADAGEGKVVGTASYEKIPFRSNGKPGLDLKNPKPTPIRFAKVELVAGNGQVESTTFTDLKGQYSLPYKVVGKTEMKVRVSAESAHVKVKDFGEDLNKTTLHAAAFPVTVDDGDVTKNVDVTEKSNHAGAFNIMEAIHLAVDVLEKAEPGISKMIPQVNVGWTAGVYPNGTSRFYPGRNLAYIKGNRDFNKANREPEGDCDEFDDYVIIHEYGHFIQTNFSHPSDSPGSNHGSSFKLDPRLAWGEGWANFFACAVLGDPRYVDTGRDEKGNEITYTEFNLDDNVPKGDRPGIWSEHSVGSILWDLFDNSKPKDGDVHAGLGFKEIWITMRQLKSRRNVTLVDFCDTLIERRPALAAQLNQILAARKIDWKTGQPIGPATPFHLPIGGMREGTLDSTTDQPDAGRPRLTFDGNFSRTKYQGYKHFGESAFFILKVEKRVEIKIDLEIGKGDKNKTADLDLYLWGVDKKHKISDCGEGTNFGVLKPKIDATKPGETESIVTTLDPGVYSVEVRSWSGFCNNETGLFSKIQWNAATFRLKASLVK